MSTTIANSLSANQLGITTNREALVALQTAPLAGFAALVSERCTDPVKGRQVREVEASDDFRLRVEQDMPLMVDFPLGTALNTRKWKTTATTHTVTVAQGRVELNSGANAAINTGSMIQSYRTFCSQKSNALYGELLLNFSLQPVLNWFAEWGFGNAASYNGQSVDGAYFRLTMGEFQGVLVNNSVVTSVDLGTIPNEGVNTNYLIEVTHNTVRFWVNDILRGTIDIPASAPAPWSVESLPFMVREYNGAVAPAAAIKLQASFMTVTLGGPNSNRLWSTVKSGMGDSSFQAPTGTAVAQTANMVNITAPASATLANATAGYATLGGQFQFVAVVGAETDYALFAYPVPVGKTLIVRGVWIDTFNTVVAVGATGTVMQWMLGAGATAITLLTADGANTKASHRVPLGVQYFPAAAPVGYMANRIDVNLDAPVVVNSGEYLHVILKMPVGLATATEVFRGMVGINGYFE